MSSKPPATTEQTSKAGSNVRATLTGLDSDGQLFRDSARVISLKGQKCVCVAAAKPARDGSVLIEMRVGSENWRSDAKIVSVSPSPSDAGSFQVTLQLDRVSSLVVEPSENEAPPPPAPKPEPKITPPPEPVDDAAREPVAKFAPPASFAIPEPPSQTAAVRKTPSPPAPEEIPAPVTAPLPSPPPLPSFPASARSSAASQTAITNVVRSVVGAELEELKQDLPDMIAEQIATALRHPLEKLEAKVERQMRKPPLLSEDFVRKAAAEAAERTQIEWAATSQDLIAETVRAAVGADGQQQRRELRRLVAGEMEAALRGTLTARIDARVNETVDARLDENRGLHPQVTEETVRQLATQAAESVNLRWAGTRLQKMITDAVRSAMAAERERQRSETIALVSESFDDILSTSLEARMEAALEKALAARADRYLETPTKGGAPKGAASELIRPPQQQAENAADPSATDRGAAEPSPQARLATETLANQIVSDVQRRLSSFSSAINQLLAPGNAPAAVTPPEKESAPTDEKTLANHLQSAGTNFEHEVEEALHKAFGKPRT